MAALAKVVSKAFSDRSDRISDALLKQLLLLLAAGLFVVAMTMTYGVDLSPGFF
ncbi:hypothetical protein; putative signal peptide [Bradyrhizobium sp. ORS 278]|uniref:hypothetical protein n=1 Tax=Bradyrhizobium sp. (strain ORS 278) TaxID=114615 RepID=UPI00015089FD|nr:hypothetical protein [Bradyrhizobium sp. ORS 278]CAL79834.1 hypothetical protein; putative signal peptide [Bradyrhizobium sp. ORS 278]